MTSSDLGGLLRQQGIGELSEVRFAIVEPRGQLSVIRRSDHSGALSDLVREAVEEAEA